MATTIECPVDFITVNENKVRGTAFFIFVLTIVYLWTPHWSIPLLFVIDFFLRGFSSGKYSPLAIVSDYLVKKIFPVPKPVDRAPKKFAAKMGFVISALLFVLTVIGYVTPGFYLAVSMLLFSFLESFIGLCVGCHVYTLLQKTRRYA